jgi:hypothetical protein
VSRADEARRRERAEERDRIAHERPNLPPRPTASPDSWEGYCAGNRTQRHGWPSDKTSQYWRCGSCGLWLDAPVRTQTCDHDFRDDAMMCISCGAVR